MSHTMFSYNQDEAVAAGVSNYINESNAYAGKIISFEWIKASTGTNGIEITFESNEGLKANFLTIYYQKSDGTMLGGSKMINAIMGCCRVQNLTSEVFKDNEGKDKFLCPELKGKDIGLILQKVLYSKNDGSDGYKFEIRLPFILGTGKSLAEQLSNKDAVTVNKILSTLTDKDDRTPSNNQQSGGQVSQQDQQMDNFIDGGWSQ